MVMIFFGTIKVLHEFMTFFGKKQQKSVIDQQLYCPESSISLYIDIIYVTFFTRTSKLKLLDYLEKVHLQSR